MTVLFPLRTQSSQGIRALNKPITILWLIGQYYHNRKTEFTFNEVEPILSDIIKDFTGAPNIVDPFWRLKNDGILSFPNENKIRINKSGGVSIVDLREYGIAGFSNDFLKYIQNYENLVLYCETILDTYFAGSMEEEILFRVALDYRSSGDKTVAIKRRKRDPKFRELVATAYNYQCAICGFHLMLGGSSIANEAAHIKWHSYRGPDTVSNGLLLCNLHHKLFDRGVFTFSKEYKMNLSDKVSSHSEGFKRWLIEYNEKPLLLPRKTDWVPSEDYLQWHRMNVYLG
ncbi:MAG: HNH endonuclease [Spirochaetales bacterium]|nr:HNH endonuclease [Spirochaetales bacterium]